MALDSARQGVEAQRCVAAPFYGAVARDAYAWDLDQLGAELSFVGIGAAPVVELDAAAFPVLQCVPVQRLVGAQDLVIAQAAVAPEHRVFLVTEIDGTCDLLPA